MKSQTVFTLFGVGLQGGLCSLFTNWRWIVLSQINNSQQVGLLQGLLHSRWQGLIGDGQLFKVSLGAAWVVTVADAARNKRQSADY